jgi:hypothetical protein
MQKVKSKTENKIEKFRTKKKKDNPTGPHPGPKTEQQPNPSKPSPTPPLSLTLPDGTHMSASSSPRFLSSQLLETPTITPRNTSQINAAFQTP